MKNLLGAVSIAALALALQPAQAAKAVVGCSVPNQEKTESAVEAMADGPSKWAAYMEIQAAQDAMLNGRVGQCAMHLGKAMHDTQAEAYPMMTPGQPHNSFALAPTEPIGTAPVQNQGGWKPIPRGE